MKRTRGMLVLIMAIVMLAPLSAKQISITWEWDHADDRVTAFRYQVNGEDPEGWIVVDTSVTSYSLGPVEDTQAFTLYVQQSYDGTSWSASGAMPYDPEQFGALLVSEAVEVTAPVETPVTDTVEAMPPSEEEILRETFIAVEPPLEEPTEDEVQPVASPVETLPAPVAPKLQRIELYAGAGGKADGYFPGGAFDPNGDYVTLSKKVLPSITLDYVRSSLTQLWSSIDLGLRAGLGYSGYSTGTTSIAGFDLHALALAQYDTQGAFSFDGGLGFAFMFTSNAIQTASTDIGVFFGPVAQVGVNYRINDTWSAGILAETRFLMANQFIPYELTGMVRLGLGYRF